MVVGDRYVCKLTGPGFTTIWHFSTSRYLHEQRKLCRIPRDRCGPRLEDPRGRLVRGSRHFRDRCGCRDARSFLEPRCALAGRYDRLGFETWSDCECDRAVWVWSFLSPAELVGAPPLAQIYIHGGSSSVGLFAIQLAKLAGMTVVTTCSPRNNDLVRSYGADHIYDVRPRAALSRSAII